MVKRARLKRLSNRNLVNVTLREGPPSTTWDLYCLISGEPISFGRQRLKTIDPRLRDFQANGMLSSVDVI